LSKSRIFSRSFVGFSVAGSYGRLFHWDDDGIGHEPRADAFEAEGCGRGHHGRGGEQEEHLVFERIAGQWPAVAEDYGLSLSPVPVIEPSEKAPWTKTMFFTGCVGAALTGPAATESAMAAAAVIPSNVVVLIVCSFGVVEKIYR
jgi:hypothetical protein